MLLDLTKPATSDNYSTAIIPGLKDSRLSFSYMLDPNYVTYTGLAVGMKRFNGGTLEEYSGTAWAQKPLGGSLTFSSGNMTLASGQTFAWGAAASALNLNGDVTVVRSDGTGAINLGAGGAHYLYFDGTNYVMPAGGLKVNGKDVAYADGSNSASTGAWAGSAASALTVKTTADVTTNATHYLGMYAASTSSNQSPKVSTKLRANPSTGDVTSDGNIGTTSDARLKKLWKPLVKGFIEKLAAVKHGVYTRKDSGAVQVGVSAQELQKVLPQAVHEGDTGYLSVAYGNAALVAAIALAKEVLELRERLDRLEDRA